MKISNRNRHSNTVKLFLGLLMATCLCAAAASAQSSFEGKFTLPYEVQWNHAVLPAGEYSIAVAAQGMPAVLRSTSTGKSVYTSIPIPDNSEKGPAALTITTHGNDRRVRSVNLPAIGMSLVFDPLTKTEREMFAKAGHIDAVPVISARK
jgi:hypothetical protein